MLTRWGVFAAYLLAVMDGGCQPAAPPPWTQSSAAQASSWCGAASRIGQGPLRGSLTSPHLEVGTGAGSATATLSLPARSPSHIHAPRRLQFSASSDGLLLWLRNECWGRGLFRLAGLLDDLLTEHQAEQPEPPLDPELEALLPF